MLKEMVYPVGERGVRGGGRRRKEQKSDCEGRSKGCREKGIDGKKRRRRGGRDQGKKGDGV